MANEPATRISARSPVSALCVVNDSVGTDRAWEPDEASCRIFLDILGASEAA